jgi:hypothetical protein
MRQRKPAAIQATGRVRAEATRRYLALFTEVRRQRVQTSAFVVLPSFTIVKGWRFGCMRRWARTRFIPDDWGLNPPIDTLPQIAQERAMLVLGT